MSVLVRYTGSRNRKERSDGIANALRERQDELPVKKVLIMLFRGEMSKRICLRLR